MFKEFVRLMSDLIKFGRNGQLHGEEEAVKCGTMVNGKLILVREKSGNFISDFEWAP